MKNNTLMQWKKWLRWRKLPLGMEILLALCIKFLLLYCLWKYFFSAPQARHMQVPLPHIEQHVLHAKE